MLVVNLFGAPGAGKSTGAALIFSYLKMGGVNVELVTEFAKDLAWENNTEALSDQVYILGQQAHRVTRCLNKADVIVTDSPLPLGILYNKNERISQSLANLTMDIFNQNDNLCYFVERSKPYKTEGRMQTEAESDKIASDVQELLDKYQIPYKKVLGMSSCYSAIVEDVLEKIGMKRPLEK